MNKKLKLFIIIALVIQIILPAGLLSYHYSVYNYALNNTPDFKIYASWFDLHSYGENGEILYGYEDEGNGVLYFDLKDMLYDEDMAVTTGADGFAVLSEAENKKLNKHWFSYDSYRKLSSYSQEEGEFEYVDTEEARKVMSDWIGYFDYYDEGGIDYNGGNVVYITAKVYKGVLIPTAIYKDDVKIITLNTN